MKLLAVQKRGGEPLLTFKGFLLQNLLEMNGIDATPFMNLHEVL